MKEENGAIRSTTRAVWEALIAEGKTPSVRTVYGRVGGKYTRIAAECRVLRQEGNGTGGAEGNGSKPPGAQQPTGKTYRCDRWPSLRLGAAIRFRNGTYATEDEETQKRIENSNWYGVHIKAQG
jgi:hypothetical protein